MELKPRRGNSFLRGTSPLLWKSSWNIFLCACRRSHWGCLLGALASRWYRNSSLVCLCRTSGIYCHSQWPNPMPRNHPALAYTLCYDLHINEKTNLSRFFLTQWVFWSAISFCYWLKRRQFQASGTAVVPSFIPRWLNNAILQNMSMENNCLVRRYEILLGFGPSETFSRMLVATLHDRFHLNSLKSFSLILTQLQKKTITQFYLANIDLVYQKESSEIYLVIVIKLHQKNFIVLKLKKLTVFEHFAGQGGLQLFSRLFMPCRFGFLFNGQFF